jgi:hypothetical protein
MALQVQASELEKIFADHSLQSGGKKPHSFERLNPSEKNILEEWE